MNSVIKGSGYCLAYTPGLMLQHGSTIVQERLVNPDGEFLKEMGKHVRSFGDCVAYWPNQVYIGNKTPEEFAKVEFPYFDKKVENAKRYGHFGEIMPENEFLLLAQACDCFEVFYLDKDFVAANKGELAKDPVITEAILARVQEGVENSVIKGFVDAHEAEPLFYEGKLVGCVKRAHDIDVNLSAEVMLENLMNKASSVLAVLHSLKSSNVDPLSIEYGIDCSEEACGDVNQRGGGNFAKAVAEIAGLENATGSDARGFCAGPSHAMIEAASLVKAGAFHTVLVIGGGCVPKLAMNGKDHVKKELPMLEDCLGSFSIVVSENDGVSAEINLDVIGRHTVGTGAAPQNVIGSLVADPLEKAGLTVNDVDKFSPEMQNADITKPAGAGDVPMANYKMIAALAVKKGWLEKADLAKFCEEKGLVGYAPTQGHIPSGVPYVGFAKESIEKGDMERVMIIGKGSLFLGRMTNLFDGVSFLIQKNTGKSQGGAVSEEEIRSLIAKSMKEFAQSILGA